MENSERIQNQNFFFFFNFSFFISISQFYSSFSQFLSLSSFTGVLQALGHPPSRSASSSSHGSAYSILGRDSQADSLLAPGTVLLAAGHQSASPYASERDQKIRMSWGPNRVFAIVPRCSSAHVLEVKLADTWPPRDGQNLSEKDHI